MKKTTYEQILADHKRQTETRQRLQAEKDVLQERLDRLKKDAEDAAGAGDLEAYTSLKADITAAQDEIYIRGAMLRKEESADLEKIAAAWNEHAGPINAQVQKKIKAYTEARAKLAQTFKGILQDLETLYIDRERLANAIGAHKNNYGGYEHKGTAIDHLLSIPTPTNAEIGQDLNFFQRMDLIDKASTEKGRSILLLKRLPLENNS